MRYPNVDTYRWTARNCAGRNSRLHCFVCGSFAETASAELRQGTERVVNDYASEFANFRQQVGRFPSKDRSSVSDAVLKGLGLSQDLVFWKPKDIDYKDLEYIMPIRWTPVDRTVKLDVPVSLAVLRNISGVPRVVPDHLVKMDVSELSRASAEASRLSQASDKTDASDLFVSAKYSDTHAVEHGDLDSKTNNRISNNDNHLTGMSDQLSGTTEARSKDDHDFFANSQVFPRLEIHSDISLPSEFDTQSETAPYSLPSSQYISLTNTSPLISQSHIWTSQPSSSISSHVLPLDSSIDSASSVIHSPLVVPYPSPKDDRLPVDQILTVDESRISFSKISSPSKFLLKPSTAIPTNRFRTDYTDEPCDTSEDTLPLKGLKRIKEFIAEDKSTEESTALLHPASNEMREIVAPKSLKNHDENKIFDENNFDETLDADDTSETHASIIPVGLSLTLSAATLGGGAWWVIGRLMASTAENEQRPAEWLSRTAPAGAMEYMHNNCLPVRPATGLGCNPIPTSVVASRSF
eukprot:Gregarina_sp_Poly_1__9996@NODE_664_length_6888_cov_103_167424_g502_i0_p1_GENE_NODE_664_length_6888_cov_103_167424_g502_i0NODE_664_length_6888_cov_103_167424_g502_i0_p1_ORF_typecomplete_len523_score67_60_NODE_664_length_6888_cov_103_167424_g502_i011082676